MEKIGVIGLGNMGMGIAKNVINDGYSTMGYDLRDSCLKELINNGWFSFFTKSISPLIKVVM